MDISLQTNIDNQQYLEGNISQDNNYIMEKSGFSFDDIKTRFKNIVENICSINKDDSDTNIDDEINDKFLELDFGAEFNIDAQKIGINDAIFFVNLLNQQNYINYKVEDNSINLELNNEKIQGSTPLLNMLKTSLETKKPIRLDFDNDVTVILRLDKEGKIQAHFIPGTSEVEQYLKTNIPALKQTFEDENINYSYLGYSKNKDNNKSRNKKRSTQ